MMALELWLQAHPHFVAALLMVMGIGPIAIGEYVKFNKQTEIQNEDD